jgi:hypothetical protein
VIRADEGLENQNQKTIKIFLSTENTECENGNNNDKKVFKV